MGDRFDLAVGPALQEYDCKPSLVRDCRRVPCGAVLVGEEIPYDIPSRPRCSFVCQ